MDDNIKQWLKLTLKNEDLFEYGVHIQGKSNKDDGYLGNITYVTVTGNTKTGAERVLDLVIKSSKEGKLRNEMPIQGAFEKEIFIYDKVTTTFRRFQRNKGIKEIIDVIPYCYGTQATGTNEFLILENLKTKGYNTLDRKTPMTFSHVKMVLEAYGKWHALSLALKHQEPEVFNELNKNNINLFSNVISELKMVDFLWEKFNYSKKCLSSVHEIEILEKTRFDRNDIKYITSDLFFEEPEYHVVLHGDCWSNNFLFKTDKHSNTLLDVGIIDWQLSCLGSPVLDLSFFLYCCSSNENFKDFEQLLKIYHNSLSSRLVQLGSDPEEVFSFNTLRRHWKIFSRYGLVMSTFMLRFAFCEPEDAPDFAEAANDGLNILDTLNFTIKNEEEYFERMKYNLLHYAENM